MIMEKSCIFPIVLLLFHLSKRNRQEIQAMSIVLGFSQYQMESQ